MCCHGDCLKLLPNVAFEELFGKDRFHLLSGWEGEMTFISRWFAFTFLDSLGTLSQLNGLCVLQRLFASISISCYPCRRKFLYVVCQTVTTSSGLFCTYSDRIYVITETLDSWISREASVLYMNRDSFGRFYNFLWSQNYTATSTCDYACRRSVCKISQDFWDLLRRKRTQRFA